MRDVKSSIWNTAEIMEKKRRICSCHGGCGVIPHVKDGAAIIMKRSLSHQ